MLVDMNMTDYLDLLASDAPAPGGGSASALCGAQGIALVSMVAGLTVGRKKYAAEEANCREVIAECAALSGAMRAQIDLDTQAYEAVSAAYKLPKNTDEERAARNDAITKAMLCATETPAQTMALAERGVILASALVGHSNVNAASDLAVAILNLSACCEGAWMNVRINLPGIRETGEDARYLSECGALFERVRALSEEALGAIRKGMAEG